MAKDNIQRWVVVDKIYGPLAYNVWTDHPPAPSDVSEWLRTQRAGWSVRPWPKTDTKVSTVTNWARQQNLKRLDYDFEPRKNIWFRESEIAMIWDLCGPK